MFHQFVYAYNSGTKSRDHFRGVSAVVRPYYRLTKMTKIVAEVGAFDEKEYGTLEVGKAQSKVSKHGAKYTLAYAISTNAGDFWQRPEIKFYVSYMNLTADTNVFNKKGEDTIGGAKKGYDTVFGAQVEAMW
ncbi:MAG: carbohydrate porin [Succinatimonas hippei]|nr:carbohydrate porin [Succinatimonas hippei]